MRLYNLSLDKNEMLQFKAMLPYYFKRCPETPTEYMERYNNAQYTMDSLYRQSVAFIDFSKDLENTDLSTLQPHYIKSYGIFFITAGLVDDGFNYLDYVYSTVQSFISYCESELKGINFSELCIKQNNAQPDPNYQYSVQSVNQYCDASFSLIMKVIDGENTYSLGTLIEEIVKFTDSLNRHSNFYDHISFAYSTPLFDLIRTRKLMQDKLLYDYEELIKYRNLLKELRGYAEFIKAQYVRPVVFSSLSDNSGICNNTKRNFNRIAGFNYSTPISLEDFVLQQEAIKKTVFNFTFSGYIEEKVIGQNYPNFEKISFEVDNENGTFTYKLQELEGSEIKLIPFVEFQKVLQEIPNTYNDEVYKICSSERFIYLLGEFQELYARLR